MLRSIIKRLLGRNKSVVGQNFHMSYSQCGEDLIIQYVFRLRGIGMPTYIDIGANDPYYLSNTALFYKRGCRGINIEANPYLIQNFKKYRPEDVNLNIGISPFESELEFYIMNDPTLSTFSKEECDNFIVAGGYKLSETKIIKTNTLQDIVNKYCNGIYPDLMSIDIEGLDFDVLKSLEYNSNSPKIICVEAADYSPIGAGQRRIELINFLTEKGYYEYANTGLNAIMVRKDFWFI
jgi:FkbM family methyltransferase